jgi:tRNA dimethylallyltransferase
MRASATPAKPLHAVKTPLESPNLLTRLLVVVGTTASGKSDLAIELARRIGRAEIVSADSRQVYRGLDVGAGKVTAEEQALVPHHLLDVADLTADRFSVADYQRLAFTAIDEIVTRARLPILVGGTGLYVRAVVDNAAYPEVAPDASVRQSLEARPLDDLVADLQRLDPAAAARMDLRNPRRVVRALEVIHLTGRSFSEQQDEQRARTRPRYDALQVGLTWPRDELRQRIDARVDARLAARPSMLDEVRGLLAAGVPAERLLELGLEYRFLTRYLLDDLSLEEAVVQLKAAIYQFARRQMTWFRRDDRIHWLDPHGDPPAQALALAEQVWGTVSGST